MEPDRLPVVALFGTPGVGKGTQGKILNAIPGFLHVSSGDIFRGLNPESDDAKEVAEYSSGGELVPDDVTIRIFRTAVEDSISLGRYRPSEHLLLLDGIPRTLNQAEILNEAFEVHAAIELTIDDPKVMIERLHGRAVEQNRADDANEDTIRHRFEVYRQQTAPLLAFYPEDLVHRINADRTPPEVLYAILDVIMPIYQDVVVKV